MSVIHRNVFFITKALLLSSAVLFFCLVASMYADSRKDYIYLDGKAVAVETSDIASIISDDCVYSVSPTSKNFTESGGTGTVAVNCGNGCNWQAQSNVPWVTRQSQAEAAAAATDR